MNFTCEDDDTADGAPCGRCGYVTPFEQILVYVGESRVVAHIACANPKIDEKYQRVCSVEREQDNDILVDWFRRFGARTVSLEEYAWATAMPWSLDMLAVSTGRTRRWVF